METGVEGVGGQLAEKGTCDQRFGEEGSHVDACRGRPSLRGQPVQSPGAECAWPMGAAARPSCGRWQERLEGRGGPGRADLSGKAEPWGPEHRRGGNRNGLSSNSKLKGIILAAAPRLGSEWALGSPG